MPVRSGSNKEYTDFQLLIPLCDTSGNVVTWDNYVEIEPRYTDGTTAPSKTFSSSGDYADPTNHDVSGSGWSYDFRLNYMNPGGNAWYNYTYDTNSGRRGNSSTPDNGTSLQDFGEYASLYLDMHIGTSPHPGTGTSYAHISILHNQFGAYYAYQYTSPPPVNYTQARTSFPVNAASGQNIKVAGQNYGRAYSQNFCIADIQAWGWNNVRTLRFINHGGGAASTSRVTITGGQLIIHGKTGASSGAGK